MVAAAFVAPYLLEATARFVDARRRAAGGPARAGHLRAARADPAGAAGPAGRALAGRQRAGPAPDRRGGDAGWVARWAGWSGWWARSSSCRCRSPRCARRSASRAWTCSTAHNVRDKARMKDGAAGRRRAVRPARAGHDAAEATRVRRARSASRWWRSHRPAPGSQATYRLDDAEHARRLAARRAAQRRAAGAARGVPRRRGAHLRQRDDRRRRPCGPRSPTTSHRRSRCCATPGSSGRWCCRATSPAPSTPASTQVGPAALRALGVRDALTHMEWFRRPDGSVAVSEVAARPPGRPADLDARLRPRLRPVPAPGRSSWCSTGSTPPQRRYASGTAYLRGLGTGRVRAVHGVDELQHGSSVTSSWSRGCPSPASRPPPTTWARATSWSGTPTPRWCATRCGRIVSGVRVELVEAL